MTITATEKRLTELKSALTTETTEADRILGTITEEKDGMFVMSSDQKAAYDASMGRAAEIGEAIKSVQKLAGLKSLADGGLGDDLTPMMESKALRAAVEQYVDENPEFRAIAERGLVGTKSIGQQTLDSEAWQEFKAANGHGNMAPVEVKDVYTTMPGTVTNLGFGRTQRDPMVPRAHRTSRVRDLFEAQQTTANLIEFYRVTGFTNGAAPVPERDTTVTPNTFGFKPQSGLSFAPDQAAVRTIAHWEAAHRNVLEDEQQLRGIIDMELLYGLRLVEDAQLLTGSGTGDNILGLLNTPDVQTYLQSAGPPSDNKADAVRRAVTKVLLANYESTGVVLNPLDWEDIELAKDDNDRYLITVAVAVGAEQRLWRLPVIDTPAIAEGTFLTGAFGIGAQIYDRQAPNIRVADQHSDYFLRNALVILAELRLAFAVKRPESFVKGTFS